MMRSALIKFENCAGLRGRCAAPAAAVERSKRTAITTLRRGGNVTCVRAGADDDLTGTVFEGHHQPLKVWVLCLYLMGLNLSNRQIAAELGLS